VFCGGKDFHRDTGIQGPLWESFIANGQPVEWHSCRTPTTASATPTNDGFQPHYADLAWPLVTDFLQRRCIAGADAPS